MPVPSVPTHFEADVAAPEQGASAVADPLAALRAGGIELPAAATLTGPVWTIPLTSDDLYAAADLWRSVRDAHSRTGWWPVLAGSDTRGPVESDPAGESISPVAGDGAAWLDTKAAQTMAELPVGVAEAFDESDADAFDWADALNACGRTFDRLMLVPARAGWLVPGLLGWLGATNVDVLGDDHATILRRWAGRWGVEPVGLDLDALTVRVLHPPADAVGALTAATEAALYCSDLVLQGTGTLCSLAPAMTQPLWTFRWD